MLDLSRDSPFVFSLSESPLFEPINSVRARILSLARFSPFVRLEQSVSR